MLGDEVPVFMIMKKLLASGWSHGPQPALHRPGIDSKCFGNGRFVARRHYLQCLLDIDHLCGSALDALPSDKPDSYYKALLHDPRVLASYEDKENGQRIPEVDIAVASDSSDVPMGSGNRPASHSFDDPPAAEPRARGVNCDVPIVDLPAGSAAGPDPPVGHRAQYAERIETSDSAASSSSGEGSQSESSGSGELLKVSQHPLDAPASSYLPGTSTHAIMIDEHLQPGQRGHYRRLLIRCPLGHCRHAGYLQCQKYRSLGANQTSHFGHREPAGFLAAWADAAHRFPDRAAHMRYVPSVPEIAQAMAKHFPGK